MQPIDLYRAFLLAAAALVLSACLSATQEPVEPTEPAQPPTEPPAPTATPSPKTTATPEDGWTLVWSDEFDLPDGSPVDSTGWTAMTGGHGWGNQEWEYYTDRVENAFHRQGSLVIRAIREEYAGSHFTSARLVTSGKGDWQYGRIEARAKVPMGHAIWPAIWMMPTDSVYGGWPKSGEIDIMEVIGKEPGTLYGTLHYGDPHKSTGGSFRLPAGQTMGDDYHVFAIEWEPQEIRWYVDGQQYHQANRWFTSAAKDAFPAPFDQKFHLIMNVAVGGVWPGFPDDTTPDQVEMLVDWVRVYQKK